MPARPSQHRLSSLSTILALSLFSSNAFGFAHRWHLRSGHFLAVRQEASDGGNGGADLQSFTSNVGGAAAAPAITKSTDGSKPFAVDGSAFSSFDEAAQRSCAVQFDACQLKANQEGGSGGGDLTVKDCETQREDCKIAQKNAKVQSFGDAPAQDKAASDDAGNGNQLDDTNDNVNTDNNAQPPVVNNNPPQNTTANNPGNQQSVQAIRDTSDQEPDQQNNTNSGNPQGQGQGEQDAARQERENQQRNQENEERNQQNNNDNSNNNNNNNDQNTNNGGNDEQNNNNNDDGQQKQPDNNPPAPPPPSSSSPSSSATPTTQSESPPVSSTPIEPPAEAEPPDSVETPFGIPDPLPPPSPSPQPPPIAVQLENIGIDPLFPDYDLLCEL